MTYLLNDIQDAVDRKFLVTKTVPRQAEAGTVVHIMGTEQGSGGINVNYRVTSTGQDFSMKFESIKQFCNWARPDSFIARYSENLSLKDVQQYIKVKNRSFVNFCLPMMLVAAVIIWAVCLIVLKEKMVIGIVIAACMTILVSFLIWTFFKTSKTKFMGRLYGKISSNWSGGSIVIK
ncbi:MAG: hypothetical protein IJ666_08905 [Ruminococcus sp.]|nr:hypothetical protein [Ruminococcus sp.]